ncbi:hypothetical protein Hanom_Chr16g01498551 [Helianthus anomalus]
MSTGMHQTPNLNTNKMKTSSNCNCCRNTFGAAGTISTILNKLRDSNGFFVFES